MPEVLYCQRTMAPGRLGTCDGVDRRLYGCWVTVMAMILSHYAGPGTGAHPDWEIDPAALDDLLTARGLYVNGCDGTDEAICRLHPEIRFEGSRSYATVPADLGQLAMDLEQ